MAMGTKGAASTPTLVSEGKLVSETKGRRGSVESVRGQSAGVIKRYSVNCVNCGFTVGVKMLLMIPTNL
jgi:hypothetical protein